MICRGAYPRGTTATAHGEPWSSFSPVLPGKTQAEPAGVGGAHDDEVGAGRLGELVQRVSR